LMEISASLVLNSCSTSSYCCWQQSRLFLMPRIVRQIWMFLYWFFSSLWSSLSSFLDNCSNSMRSHAQAFHPSIHTYSIKRSDWTSTNKESQAAWQQVKQEASHVLVLFRTHAGEWGCFWTALFEIHVAGSQGVMSHQLLPKHHWYKAIVPVIRVSYVEIT
jgi:hypothetical protein